MSGAVGSPSAEGRDPLLQRDKGKRKRGWGSIGLYLDKRKNHGLGQRKIQSLTEGLSQDWGQLPGSCTWGGEELVWARWLGQGHSLQQEKVIPSLECCGTGQSLPAFTSQRPHIGWCRVALLQYRGVQSESLNPSQVPGHGNKQSETNHLVCAHNSDDGLNRVVWDSRSMEEGLECCHFSPHHHQSGVSGIGLDSVAHSGSGTCLQPNLSCMWQLHIYWSRIDADEPDESSSRPVLLDCLV